MGSEASRWETFPHDADCGVRGLGPTREAAFEQAARALTAVVADLDRVEPHVSVEIACDAPDEELLLLEWLNAVVYEMDTRHMLFSRFEVSIDGERLTGRAHGEAIDVERHRPAVEVKGATCTELIVSRDGDGTWSAQCVVDV